MVFPPKLSRIVVAFLALALRSAPSTFAWDNSSPFRVLLKIEPETVASNGRPAAQPQANRVVRARIDFATVLKGFGEKAEFDARTLRAVAIDGDQAAKHNLPIRWDHRYSKVDQSYRTAGDMTFVVSDPATTQVAVYFGAEQAPDATAETLIGDGDLLREVGSGTRTLAAPGCYPVVIDFDGDGRRDLLGSDRYGTGSHVVWFRNIGSDASPKFSQREFYPLETAAGARISNPNHGWLLTPALADFDGDGRVDLFAGGWCRYLTFHKNVAAAGQPVFDDGRRIFDARALPGLDYGRNPDTPYQGVFIEPCDWDGDGHVDLLCGTYLRGHIYLLRNSGRMADGLPVLEAPQALEANGKEIDFLYHAKPSVADWDGDGDLDLWSGQYYTEDAPHRNGTAGVYYFENQGTRREPKLAAGVAVRDVAGRVLTAGYHSEPTMVDWNLDGAMDLLVSGSLSAQLYLNQGTPKSPKLAPSPLLCEGLAECRVDGFAYPVAYDLDRDGTLDLIVGDGSGVVSFFRGQTDGRFAPAKRLKSAGVEIDEVGCPDGGEAHRGYVKVAIAEWNDDDYADLVMWTNNGMAGWQRGKLADDGWCLKFFPGTADPFDFGPPSEIRAGGQHIRAGYRSKPDVVDLDDDGLLDLVVACGSGKVNDQCTIMFAKNVGSKSNWKLADLVPLTHANGAALGVSVRTAVRLVDWDSDGDLDLFTGNQASIGLRYWENVGTKAKPTFAQPKAMKQVNEICGSHHEIGVDVVDFDQDGSLDLLVGNGDSGTIHFFRSEFLTGPTPARISAVESRTGKRRSSSELGMTDR
jgi:hypothetical protein